MYAAAPPPQDDYSGAVLCLVIFLMLMLIFRGAQNRRNCVVYLQDDAPGVPEVSYAETPPVEPKQRAPRAKHGPELLPKELGNPTKAGMFSRY